MDQLSKKGPETAHQREWATAVKEALDHRFDKEGSEDGLGEVPLVTPPDDSGSVEELVTMLAAPKAQERKHALSILRQMVNLPQFKKSATPKKIMDIALGETSTPQAMRAFLLLVATDAISQNDLNGVKSLSLDAVDNLIEATRQITKSGTNKGDKTPAALAAEGLQQRWSHLLPPGSLAAAQRPPENISISLPANGLRPNCPNTLSKISRTAVLTAGIGVGLGVGITAALIASRHSSPPSPQAQPDDEPLAPDQPSKPKTSASVAPPISAPSTLPAKPQAKPDSQSPDSSQIITRKKHIKSDPEKADRKPSEPPAKTKKPTNPEDEEIWEPVPSK